MDVDAIGQEIEDLRMPAAQKKMAIGQDSGRDSPSIWLAAVLNSCFSQNPNQKGAPSLIVHNHRFHVLRTLCQALRIGSYADYVLISSLALPSLASIQCTSILSAGS